MFGVFKTTAQLPFYYYKGSKVEMNYSSDKLLLRIRNDKETRTSIREMLSNNRNFQLLFPDSQELSGEYFVIGVPEHGLYSVSEAIQEFKELPFVLSVSQAFDKEGMLIATGNDIYIKARSDVDPGAIDQVLSQFGYLSKVPTENLPNVYVVDFPKSVDVLHTANALFQTDLFEFAEPNFFVQSRLPSGCTTTDPNFPDQWSLNNTGQFGGTSGMDVDACNAWAITTGEPSIKIAILDNGVDLTHPDLNVLTALGFDATGGGSGGGCATNEAHGTLCSGIAAAKQNNGIGPSGVAPSCSIVPIRIGTGTLFISTTNTYIVNSINHAAANADVISMSFNIAFSSVIDAAINSAYWTGRGGMGCLMVAATGNGNNSTVSYPASNSQVLAVGAMSMCGERKTPTSCDGVTTWGSNYGPEMGVVAPGVHNWSTDIQGANGETTNDYYEYFGGTSSATPCVAGVAGLILSTNPCLNVAELRSLLAFTADKVGSVPYTPVAGGGPLPATSWNNEMGYGKVNANKAVILAHDVYRQDENISSLSSSYLSSSVNKLYAGRNVTTLKPVGDYTVGSAGIVGFKARESIEMLPGFTAQYGCLFFAEIDNPCTTGYVHWKPGSISSSDTKQSADIKDGYDETTIYPNPTTGVLNIAFNGRREEVVSITIVNVLGQMMLQREFMKKAGGYTEALSIGDFVPGNYFVLVRIGKEIHQSKITKM